MENRTFLGVKPFLYTFQNGLKETVESLFETHFACEI